MEIADVSEFMKQSETKKINDLFDLFPNDALATIDTEIEEAKEDVSRIEKKISGAKSTVVRLTNSKSAIELPPGSISEVQAEIKSIDEQIADVENKINDAKIEQAKVEEREKVEKEKEKEPKKMEPMREFLGSDSNIIEPFIGHDPAKGKDETVVSYNSQSSPSESIQRIIDALNGAGCGTCAALIVAKHELKKF